MSLSSIGINFLKNHENLEWFLLHLLSHFKATKTTIQLAEPLSILLRKGFLGCWYSQKILEQVKDECEKRNISAEITIGIIPESQDMIVIRNPFFHLAEATLMILENYKLNRTNRLRYLMLFVLPKVIPQLKNIHISMSTIKELSKPLQEKLLNLSAAEDLENARRFYLLFAPKLLNLNSKEYKNTLLSPPPYAPAPQKPRIGGFWTRKGITNIWVPIGKWFKQ